MMRSKLLHRYVGWNLIPISILICLASFFADSDLAAQQSAQLPSRNSYNAAVFAEFYRADYKDAEREFRRGYNAS